MMLPVAGHKVTRETACPLTQGETAKRAFPLELSLPLSLLLDWNCTLPNSDISL